MEMARAGDEIFGCILFFPSQQNALGFVKAAREKSRNPQEIIEADTIDYFDGNALKFIKKTSPDVPDNAGAAVFIEQIITGDGEEQLAAWMEMFEEFGVIEDWSALTDKDRERLRLFRHSLPENVNETMRQRGMKKMGMDLAVPDDRLDDIMKIYAGEGGQTGVEYVLFGHIGDNNLHMNFLPKDESQMETVRAAYLSIAAKAIAMGGTISAEHGVGKKQFPVNGKMTPYLGLMYNEKELQSIATVKKTLDPYMLLNRNNMLPT
jgi:D-lactate dehydrogenase (cytochrome)